MELGLGLPMSLSPGIALSSRVFCDETRKKKKKASLSEDRTFIYHPQLQSNTIHG
jgi:hypothetical protein